MVNNAPSVYKSPSVYKTAGGGGGVDIDIEKFQGSRGIPDRPEWPDEIGDISNRVCTQILYLEQFIGKKITINSGSDDFLIGTQDGTEYNEPFNSYSWDREVVITIQYGTITIAARRADNTDLTPNDINISVVLTN